MKRHWKPNKKTEGSDRTNEDRAEGAYQAAALACKLRGECMNVDEDAIRDLLADLGHVCDREDCDYKRLVQLAIRDWEEERG